MNKLYCGDCLEVMAQLAVDKVKVDAVITDIPYGILDPKHNKWDVVIPLDQMWAALAPLVHKKTPIILFGRQPFTSYLNLSNVRHFRYEIVWQKDKGSDFANANRKPLNAHENISVFYERQPDYVRMSDPGEPYDRFQKTRTTFEHDVNFKGDNRGHWVNTGSRTPTSVRYYCRSSAKRIPVLHPTEKPIELMEWLVQSYALPGATVLDFTMGSGTTGVACKKTGRDFIGIEKDDHYFEVARKRIEGTRPVLKLVETDA